MRRRRLTLQEKVFVVKSYYANHEIGVIVQEHFNTEYKVQTTEALLKTINQIVSCFEKTGSVTRDVYFERGAVSKADGEHIKTTPEEIKLEEEIEFQPDNRSIEEDQVVASEETHYALEDEHLDTESWGEVSEPEEESIDTNHEQYEPRKYRRKSDSTQDDGLQSPITCPICNKHFPTKKARNRHKEIHRPLDKYIPCTICERPCRTNMMRMAHELSHISEWEVKEPFKCDVCGKTFRHSAALSSHLKNHQPKDLECVCEVCGKTRASSHSLTAHMRTHTGERPFKCKLCPKTFSTKSGQSIHYRTHTGEKPYKCETCGKGFGDSSTLKVHHRQHTGESPYVCQYCGKTCKQAQNLRSHIRHMHKSV